MTTTERDRTLILTLAERTGMSPSQIAVKAGVAASTLTRVVNGTHRLSVPTLEKLSAAFPGAFGVLDDDAGASDYLEVEMLPSFAGMGGGGTGEGEPGRALVSRRMIEDRLHARASDLLMIEARGDSMSPDFEHGDQILIDKRDVDPTQPGPFALWDGDAYVIKLVERLPNKRGWFRIFSANDRYTAYEITAEEMRLLGRPVWFGRAL